MTAVDENVPVSTAETLNLFALDAVSISNDDCDSNGLLLTTGSYSDPIF